MEANNNSENKSESQYSTESNPSRPGQSSSNSQLQDKSRDRKHKKRSRSPEIDWNMTSKNKETPDRLKKPKHDKMEEDKLNGNQPYDVSSSSQQMATALQQQMAVTIPPNQPIMHQPPIYTSPYPPFGYGTPDNYMDPNQGNYAMMPSYNMMPMPPQWPVNNGLALPSSNVEISPSVCATPVSNGVEMMPSTSSAMVPYPYMGMANDSSNFGMVPPPPMENYYPPQVMPPPIIPKFTPNTPIVLSNAVLTPPLPGELISRRVKPDGCRTVYVGCLPEKITQDIIKEAFERCGSIFTIRMSEKHFCHIRFEDMESVEQALLLSGYRIKIEDKDDPAYTGKLHVDYATARDDQHDFECRKRQMQREERHRARDVRPPSPPPLPHYSEHEAAAVNEKLRNSETFKDGVRVLLAWLERGECTKRSTGTFYSMLQSTNSHAKRLCNEKCKAEEEVKKATESLKKLTCNIQIELSDIEKVYTAAEIQKNWDHFSKNQRRHIEDWKKETASFSAALITARVEEDMDLEVDENNAEECSNEDQIDNDELYMLRESNDTLKQQLTSTEKELDEYKQTCGDYLEEILNLRALGDSRRVGGSEIYEIADGGSYFENVRRTVSFSSKSIQCVQDRVDVTENETCLVSLISIFLHVHPFGASIDYICSYLLKTHPTITTRDVESLMRKFPLIFEEVSTGIGATLEKKWKYVGFQSSFPYGR